jgi:hypothetical protein
MQVSGAFSFAWIVQLHSFVGEGRTMQPLLSSLPVMSVTTIFFAWNVYCHALVERRRSRLRERVAYMLWTASDYAA